MVQARRNIARANHNTTTTLTAAVPTVALLAVDLCLVTDSGFATMTFVPW